MALGFPCMFFAHLFLFPLLRVLQYKSKCTELEQESNSGNTKSIQPDNSMERNLREVETRRQKGGLGIAQLVVIGDQ
jgi:hypothetical protein